MRAPGMAQVRRARGPQPGHRPRRARRGRRRPERGAGSSARRRPRAARGGRSGSSHCSPRLPASIASLASRSACLFCSRGIHSYVTWSGGKTRPASAASGRMSGCLIFQRPDICSTTSLESIRTRTCGRRVQRRARPAGRRSGPGTRRRCWWRCRCTRRPRPASPRSPVEHDRAVAGGPRVAPGAAVASTMNARRGHRAIQAGLGRTHQDAAAVLAPHARCRAAAGGPR